MIPADPATFQYFGSVYVGDGGLGAVSPNDYYTDKDYIFVDGKVLTGADPKSFMFIGDTRYGYVGDKYGVFCTNVDKKGFPTARLVASDTQTFKVVLADKFLGVYAKDKNHIYVGCTPVSNADPTTFELLKDSKGNFSGYAKDKNHVYYINYPNTTALDASPNTFVLVSDDPTDNYLYIPSASVYAKDGSSVFFSGEKIIGADPASFEIIKDPSGTQTSFAKDKNNVYYGAHTVQRLFGRTLNPKTIVVFPSDIVTGETILKDGMGVYRFSYNNDNSNWTMTTISGTDPITFQPLYASSGEQSVFEKDKNNVYCHGSILVGADVQTFALTYPDTDVPPDLAKDKNQSYLGCSVAQ